VADAYEPAEVYVGLRGQALAVTRELLDPETASAGPLVALLMETGYPEAVATLVGLADGTTSMYFSNGGGMIGAGQHEDVAAATRRWLELGEQALDRLPEAPIEVHLPDEGMTQLVAVTETGRRAARAPEEELGGGGHPLSALFYAGHDVITAIRLVDEGAAG
jgi:hypothetical protein